MFKWNFLYFRLHSLPLLSLGTTEKGLLSLSIHQVFTDSAQKLLNFLPFRLNHHSSPSFCQVLQSFNHLCGPSLSLLQNINVSLLLACPGMGIALQTWSQVVMVRGTDCFPLLAVLFLMQPRRLLAALATFIICLCGWGEADYWPVVLHTHPSWRQCGHPLYSSSQEPPLITRPLKDNWEYPYNIFHFLSILRCTLPNPTDSHMSLLAPNFTSLTSSPWFVCKRTSKEPVFP